VYGSCGTNRLDSFDEWLLDNGLGDDIGDTATLPKTLSSVIAVAVGITATRGNSRPHDT
jgi:hypothetical protein